MKQKCVGDMSISVNPIRILTFKGASSGSSSGNDAIAKAEKLVEPKYPQTPAVVQEPLKLAQAPQFPVQMPQAVAQIPVPTVQLPQSIAQTPQPITQVPQKSTVSKVATSWVSTSEAIKGIVTGLFSGLIVGGLTMGIDMIVSGSIKKFKNQISFKEMIKPSKAMSKTGMILAPALAGLVFGGHLFEAYFNAKRKTQGLS